MAGEKQQFQDLGFGSMSSSSLSSFTSFGSTDLTDDATSSSSCNSSDSGPLYQLSDLMAQLPIKRGLSKFYNGKSQTFGSLANVKSVEDLGKKETMNQRMKSCKSYGGNLNNHHKFGPKATIRKRSPPVTMNRTISIHFKC